MTGIAPGLATPERPRMPSLAGTAGVIAIGRGLPPSAVVTVAQALLGGGVRALEITLNSPGALDSIATLDDRFDGAELLIGAGTVLDIAAAEAAVGAGARFLVMPHTDVELVRWAAARRIPAFPGGLTPTEILAAWRAGAAAVKLFPASVVGPGFVRELRGPFRDIPLIPTGGVTLESAASFIVQGAVAVAVGSWLTGSGDPSVIRQRAYDLVAAIRGAREAANVDATLPRSESPGG